MAVLRIRRYGQTIDIPLVNTGSRPALHIRANGFDGNVALISPSDSRASLLRVRYNGTVYAVQGSYPTNTGGNTGGGSSGGNTGGNTGGSSSDGNTTPVTPPAPTYVYRGSAIIPMYDRDKSYALYGVRSTAKGIRFNHKKNNALNRAYSYAATPPGVSYLRFSLAGGGSNLVNYAGNNGLPGMRDFIYVDVSADTSMVGLISECSGGLIYVYRIYPNTVDTDSPYSNTVRGGNVRMQLNCTANGMPSLRVEFGYRV